MCEVDHNEDMVRTRRKETNALDMKNLYSNES